MAGGTTTTTSSQTAQPYGQAKPLINMALKDAKNAYTQGYGGKTFTGSTVVPFAKQTTAGMNDVMAGANANMGGKGLSGNMQNIINNGGFSQDQMASLGQMKNTANSTYDMNANPGFADILAKAQNDARGQTNMTAAAAGRYGSGVHQGAVAREVGNTTANMLSNDYNTWLGRKDTATNNLFNASQSGLGNMASAYGAMQDPAKAAMGIGSMNEDLYKRTIDDKLRIFNERQNAPWDQISRLMGTANLTGQYAPHNTTSTAPGPNPLLSALGGVSTGYGLLGNMGVL